MPVPLVKLELTIQAASLNFWLESLICKLRALVDSFHQFVKWSDHLMVIQDVIQDSDWDLVDSWGRTSDLSSPRSSQGMSDFLQTHTRPRENTDSGALQLSRKHKDGAVENYNSKLTRSEIVLCQKSSALAGGRGGNCVRNQPTQLKTLTTCDMRGKQKWLGSFLPV